MSKQQQQQIQMQEEEELRALQEQELAIKQLEVLKNVLEFPYLTAYYSLLE